MSENEWELVRFHTSSLGQGDPWLNGSFSIWNGYEYRVQRRINPEPMPEIKPGDLLVYESGTKWYVLQEDVIKTFSYIKHYRDGKLLWERK